MVVKIKKKLKRLDMLKSMINLQSIFYEDKEMSNKKIL